jgi:hypothetical protein
MATVTTLRSSGHKQVPIEVTADNDNVMWQAKPGALLFLAEEGISPRSSTPTASAAAVPVRIGTPVRDGSLEFVVKSMKRAPSVTSPTEDYIQQQARGEFVILDLSVTNTGDQAATYMSANQKLIINGKQYDDATEASVTLNGNAISQITPGLGIDTEIAFDVPVGANPGSVLLHESTLSPGVYVNLGSA